VKRTVAYCTHPEHGDLKLAKGLVDKVLSTGEDGGDCWEVEDFDNIREIVREEDLKCSAQGYKTVGVAAAKGHEGKMKFVGMVPMLDPPREDTMLTIYRIRQAGVAVKMITGDHLNIAIETSRLIGLGANVLPATDLWPASATRDELVMSADGFAQVLPKDKRECVLILQNRGIVVGMTGDGVNDAPALAQAQIGIAVDGASEAARSAADIVLTSPGLSPIFDAVAESRMIFARLRAYVLYRLAATIQIVLVLSILIFKYDDPLKALYVILLALLNDVSMLPIAADNASASALPEIPSMQQILVASALYGLMETLQTMALYMGEFVSCDAATTCGGQTPEAYLGTATYLQISIAVELLIFSCRAPGFILHPYYVCGKGRPSLALFVAVMGSNVLVSVFAGFGIVISKVQWNDIAYIWAYDVACLLAIDLFKCLLKLVGIGWLSAGAQGGTLEYVDLPEDEASHRSTALQASAAGRSRTGRSLFTSSATGLARQVSSNAGDSVVHRSHRRSASTLPFPYNLRAASTHSVGAM